MRLFGFLGAGATLGQLAGSLAATAAGRLASQSSDGGDAAATALQLSLLLGAAAFMECAGRLVGGVRRRTPSKAAPEGAQPAGRDGLEEGVTASKVTATAFVSCE